MYSKSKTGLFVLITSLYISSCAHQSSPTGGPMDEDPPALTVSIPENESLNFQGQRITLEFNEYIKLNNPKEEILITPRLLGEYEIKYKKNKVILELEDSLQTNTTYTFNFREGIQDLNESNSPDIFQLAFSTGDYLDSLSITGNSFNLLNNKPGKDITISLYDATDTLNIFNSPPIYFTKTNPKGDFIFNNLKNGQYNIYAINDKNKNLILESKNEPYAYIDQSITLDSNLTQIILPLINLDITPPEMQSSRSRGHYFVLKYNKYISSYSQKPLLNDETIPTSSFSKDHREIKYYNSISFVDSLGIIIDAFDTINNQTIDTVYLKFEETKRARDNFEFTSSKISLDKTKPIVSTEISFTKPVSVINFDSIYFQIDSTKNIRFDSTDFTWNSNLTLLTITKEINPELFIRPEKETVRTDSISRPKGKPDRILANKREKNSSTIPAPPRKNNDTRLYLGTTAFLSIEQDSSIYYVQKATMTDPSTTGSILIEIETVTNSFFTQLINTTGEIIAENNSEKKFSFENTPPGNYTIRILVDKNENNVWDIGDITKNIMPEPVIFYISEEGTSEITIRANWILGPNLIKF